MIRAQSGARIARRALRRAGRGRFKGGAGGTGPRGRTGGPATAGLTAAGPLDEIAPGRGSRCSRCHTPGASWHGRHPPSLFGDPRMSITPRRLAAALCALLLPAAASAAVFINETHYDACTTPGDTGERIEVVSTAAQSLSGYRIYLYNGTSSPTSATYYDNDAVPTGAAATCGQIAVRFATVSYPSNGIQNGANDAIALVGPTGQLVQFLSYEGS